MCLPPISLLVTQQLTQGVFQGLDILGHPGNPQCTNQNNLSAVPKLQIGSIFYFPGLYPPLVDCVYDLLWHGVLSPLAPFEDAPSFQTEEFVGNIENTHWYYSNGPMCYRSHGIGRVWFIVY